MEREREREREREFKCTCERHMCSSMVATEREVPCLALYKREAKVITKCVEACMSIGEGVRLLTSLVLLAIGVLLCRGMA